MTESQEKKLQPVNKKITSVLGKKYIELLNKYFKFIAILLSVIVLFFGYLFVVYPKWQTKERLSNQLSILDQEIGDLSANKEFLSQYSAKLLEFTPKEERDLTLALPDKFDLPSIIVQLTELASDNKFIVENISAEEVNGNNGLIGNLKRIDIEMVVNGVEGSDYGNFSKFIDALESSIMIFDVRAISFTPGEMGYQLELSTYYYPQK